MQSSSEQPSLPAPLSDEEIDAVLADLDSFETPEEVLAQREYTRIPYHAEVGVVCEAADAAGGGVRFTATAHDLSDGGLGFISPQLLTLGTTCMLTMVGSDGNELSVRAEVVSQEVYGRPAGGAVYLCGAKFDLPIRAEALTGMRQTGSVKLDDRQPRRSA